jgi:hypothetical protein
LLATVIADGKSKYTGMKILRLLLWLLVINGGNNQRSYCGA